MIKPFAAITTRMMVGTAAAAICIAAASTADAGRRGDRAKDDYVVAESQFGNGTVVGPVRYTSVGRQVRTPAGSWLHCARSCSETLRVNTVDFWQSEASTSGDNNAITQEDGLLSRWLHWQRRY